MEKLINPVPNPISVSKNGKSIVFGVKPNMSIVAPYNGIHETAGNNTIRIKHTINGKKYYSDIENVGKVMISTTRVVQNEKIGETGSADIIFKVLDENFKVIDIDSVFEKEDKDKYGDKSSLTGLDVLKAFATPVTVPISLLKMAGKHVFKKIKGEGLEKTENTINEEVERIKQLMK